MFNFLIIFMKMYITNFVLITFICLYRVFATFDIFSVSCCVGGRYASHSNCFAALFREDGTRPKGIKI